VSERFVGRERELSRLAVALDSALHGHSQRVLLAGAGGIGVSRLVEETIRRVEHLPEPFQVVHCRAVAPHAIAPYASIPDALGPCGETRPVLLVLEDPRHADAGSRGLATFLARVARPARLCLIATYGTDRLARGHPLLPELNTMSQGSDPPDRLELAPLDRAE